MQNTLKFGEKMLSLNANVLVIKLLIIMSSTYVSQSLQVSPLQCNASSLRSCNALLYYIPETNRTLEQTAELFSVNSSSVNITVDGFLINVQCSCQLSDRDAYGSIVNYTVQNGDSWTSLPGKFGSFLVQETNVTLVATHAVSLDLLCGCLETKKNVLSYRVRTGDTIFAIAQEFGADLNQTLELNSVRLKNPLLIKEGDIVFVPDPARIQNLTQANDGKDSKSSKGSQGPRIRLFVGIISAVSAILLLVLAVCWFCYRKRRNSRQSNLSGQTLQCLPCYLAASPKHSRLIENLLSSFSSERATVFTYDEIYDATSNFSVHLKIGQGSYGCVYHGKLRGKDVAVKQMKSTKSKEFFSELNILCKVHHTNLIELIGYAAGRDSLFLIYEYAENGALSDHLHNSKIRDAEVNPLGWTTRVQIALDAAKGLEYIHAHIKPYYVHRDVKTSNILLDSQYRAKIADFGLVKLLEQSPEVGTEASRIVGTFGYLAPEYVRDGVVTTKSDVYGFGVVLMELLTCQPALSRDANPENSEYGQHRSLVDYMLLALEHCDESLTQLTQCVDSNLVNYHKDSLFQMALLSKDCVDEDWNRRPDMGKVVSRLSDILNQTNEWEKLESSSLKN